MLLLFTGLALAVPGQANIFDDFNRADGAALGNGWIEKTPEAFALAGGSAVKQSTFTGYLNNIVYRPAAEDVLDVEVSAELRVTALPVGYPQIFARVQSATAGIEYNLDAYILYINYTENEAILGRQLGADFVTTLATLNLSPPLNTSDTFRLRLRAQGTNPVQLNAWVERRNGTAWDIIGQATYSDNAANRIATAGSVGFGGYVESGYSYDNFRRTNLSGAGNPVPVTSGISPNAATAGDPGFTLTVDGTGFVAGSVVRWNGADRTTTFISSTQLQAAIPATDIASSGTATVTVFNPAPGGGLSNAQGFTINDPAPAPNPVPAVATLSPVSATAGGAGFTLTVVGSGFVAGSVIRWNGADRGTTFVSATQLQAAIPASDIAVAGTAQVTVFNPAPGGGESAALNFTIDPLPSGGSGPAIGALTPADAQAGDPGLALVVDGANFDTTSVVRWNGADRTTTFISATRLQAQIDAADLANAGMATVTVYTPGTGGGTSAPHNFFILDAQSSYFSDDFNRADNADIGNGWTEKFPVAFSLQGGQVTGIETYLIDYADFHDAIVYRPAGEDQRDVEVGMEFVRGPGGTAFPQVHARVQRDSIDVQNTLQSYIFFIDDYEVAPGAAVIAVVRPVYGELECYLSSIPLPSALQESQRYRLRFRVTGDYPVTLTGIVDRFNGQTWEEFASGTVVHDNNTPPGSFCDPGTTPAPISTAGAVGFAKWFTQPDSYDNFYWLGGATAGNPVPVATSLNPASATAGDPGFTLTVNGSDFSAGSVVQWNGSPRPTSFVSATQLQASISAADIAAAGTASVTVVTPAPGGGTSAALGFTINDSGTGDNPVPAIGGLSPASASAGGAAFTLTVNGSGFVAGSVVRWNGADRATTFVSATQLQAAIPASDIAAAGTAAVTVFNPAPGGGVSAAANFTVLAAGSDFLDDFNRTDSSALGNGWLEKNPNALFLVGGRAVKQSVFTGYLNNIAYRPASEDLLNVETSVELQLQGTPPGYPQIFARVQSATAGLQDTLDAYILYVNYNENEAILGRQLGADFVTTLATLSLNPVLNTTDTFRMRLRATGTNPVVLDAAIERLNGSTWEVIGQATYNDAAANRISTPGSVGFGGYIESGYIYDNFRRIDLGP